MNKVELNKKTLLIALIFVQMGLHFFAFMILDKREYNWIEYLSVFLALGYSFIAYLALLLNNKDKSMIYYYCIATMMVSVFLLVDIGILKYIEFSYRYIQIIILIIILDITLQILTQNISGRLFYKYIILTLWTIGVILLFLKREVYLLIYQITFLIISIYPVVFFIYNYKRIKNYGSHLIPILLIIIFSNTIFILFQYMIENSGKYNYDLYIYLNLIEFFLSNLILSALGFSEFIKNKKLKVNTNMFILGIFILGYMYCGKENLMLSFFSVFSFAVIITQCQLLDYYLKLTVNKRNDIYMDKEVSEVFKSMIERNIENFEKEELYREQLADFLHDEILQDAIYIKKELRDRYNISIDDNISNIAEIMINKTRGQISLYRPYINYKMRLSENYYNLIKSLKNKFGNDNILVDFICDNDFFLSSPYDLVVYRVLHELVNNIYKHSKGEYSVVELELKDNTIYIRVTNYGDYLKDGYMGNMESRGLRIIKRELDRFGGTFDMNMTEESNKSNEEGTFDNCEVNINITIPVKGDKTYEHFINR